jgi:hypothetical protein
LPFYFASFFLFLLFRRTLPISIHYRRTFPLLQPFWAAHQPGRGSAHENAARGYPRSCFEFFRLSAGLIGCGQLCALFSFLFISFRNFVIPPFFPSHPAVEKM